MALGMSDYSSRYRRRRTRGAVKLAVYAGILAVTGLLAYDAGIERAAQPTVELKDEITRLQSEKQVLQATTGDLSVEIERLRSRLHETEALYRREVPNDATKTLLGLARDKLRQGVPVERLSFVMRETKRQRDCADTPATKRFIVSTPINGGAAGSVTFFDNAVTVTGTGQPARDDSGNPEAWFDPAQPVAVRLVHLDGSQTTSSGKLPLHHSLVISDTEFRFSVTQGPQGFVYVTGDRCKFP